jgi:hypothetical protein
VATEGHGFAGGGPVALRAVWYGGSLAAPTDSLQHRLTCRVACLAADGRSAIIFDDAPPLQGAPGAAGAGPALRSLPCSALYEPRAAAYCLRSRKLCCGARLPCAPQPRAFSPWTTSPCRTPAHTHRRHTHTPARAASPLRAPQRGWWRAAGQAGSAAEAWLPWRQRAGADGEAVRALRPFCAPFLLCFTSPVTGRASPGQPFGASAA